MCARRARVAQVDPDTEDPFAPDGGLLGAVPLSKDGTYMRTIPEFKYWYRLTKAFAVAFSLTFFELFNVPVSRPILVMYFVLLFFQARTSPPRTGRTAPARRRGAPPPPPPPSRPPTHPTCPTRRRASASQAGKRQIEHMIKYQYLPCSFGKKPSSPGAKTLAV
jgi:hypothetical protein